MAKKTYNQHTPKAYAKDAVKRMIKLISGVKDDMPMEIRDKLRPMVIFAHNYNDEKTLRQIVKEMNYLKYQTRISFQVLTCWHKDHGHNYLEIREERF